MKQTRQIILGSNSPRRKQLLEFAGFTVLQMGSTADETYESHLTPTEIVEFLALKKALSLASKIPKEAILITADTIVSLDQQILEKPANFNEAAEMLSRLSNRQHTVTTGVHMRNYNEQVTFSDTTIVYFQALSKDEIEYYIEEYSPLDKAGSYGIQDWMGWCKVRKIEGSYSTVMGLPMDLVYHQLKQWKV